PFDVVGSSPRRMSVHIRPKNSIDARLIAAFAAEPFEKVGVQSHSHGRLRPRYDDARILPESIIGWLRIWVVDDRGMYLLIGHRAETPPVSLGLSLRGGSRSIVAHEVRTSTLIRCDPH